MRVLPWLLCWISGSAFGAGLAPLVVSPDLVRDAPARPAVPSPAVSTPAPQPVGASPAPAASPVAETVADTWRWLTDLGGSAPQRPDRTVKGLDPQVEAKVLGTV